MTMTNGEKFKEIFGFIPDSCPLPPKIVCKKYGFLCSICPCNDFWNKEYKECFELINQDQE